MPLLLLLPDMLLLLSGGMVSLAAGWLYVRGFEPLIKLHRQSGPETCTIQAAVTN
jgi:hypothetical protein